MKIKAIIWQEDDVWYGSVPALPGCHTWASSYEEVVRDACRCGSGLAGSGESQEVTPEN